MTANETQQGSDGRIKVETFADHQVIRQPNPLKRAVKRVAENARRSGRPRRASARRPVGRVRELDEEGVRPACQRAPVDPRDGPEHNDPGRAVPRRARHQGGCSDLRLSDGRGGRRQPVPDHGACARLLESAGRPGRASCECRSRRSCASTRSWVSPASPASSRTSCAASPTNISPSVNQGPPRASRSDPRPEHRAGGIDFPSFARRAALVNAPSPLAGEGMSVVLTDYMGNRTNRRHG